MTALGTTASVQELGYIGESTCKSDHTHFNVGFHRTGMRPEQQLA